MLGAVMKADYLVLVLCFWTTFVLSDLQPAHHHVPSAQGLNMSAEPSSYGKPKRQTSEVTVEACTELPYPYNTKQKWIIGENAMNGLSNQLFGIYSYVPVALLWNVSLVLGDVYSRDSFENAMGKYEGWNSLPFSEFFDFPHFQETWAKRGLAVIEHSTFNKSCIASAYKTYTIEREPHFWPNKDLIMNKMLALSHIPNPVPDRSVLQFDALRPKFTALYNFWKGGMKNKLLLLHVHRSIRPAVHIRRVVEAVLGELPRQFLVAHVRLEGDYLLHEKTTFEAELEAALSTINTHSCLEHLQRTPIGQVVDPPAIYIASGLFTASLYRVSSGSGSGGSSGGGSGVGGSVGGGGSGNSTRAEIVLQRLRDMGFTKIYTREGLLGAVVDRIVTAVGSDIVGGSMGNVVGGMSTSTSSKYNTYNNLTHTELATLSHTIQSLAPEQVALVDLTISRSSQCFISSHYSSSFSYMAQRMRVMDKGQVLRYPEIVDANFGKSGYFKQWGL